MDAFTPSDPNYETRVRSSFQRQQVMAWIGAELTHLAPGRCEITLPRKPELTQQHGYLHGGILGTGHRRRRRHRLDAGRVRRRRSDFKSTRAGQALTG